MAWCKEQINETLNAFQNITTSEIKDLANICLKNDDDRFGVIFRDDIDADNWMVIDAFNDNKYIYDDLEAMVNAGWIVD